MPTIPRPSGDRRSYRSVASLLGAAAVALTLAGTSAAPAQAASPDPELAGRLAQVMSDTRVQRASVGGVVLEAVSGRVVWSRRAGTALVPASNTKVLTAVSALHTLGPGHRFATEVIRRGPVVGGELQGRIYLKGYGDPTTRQADYRRLAEQVRAAGVRRVTGRLAVDSSHFDAQRYNPGWSTGYAGASYAAEVSALTVAPNADYDSGTVLIRYAPGRRGARARITTTPAAAARYVRITNETTTGGSTSSSTVSVQRRHGSNTVTVSGRVPLGRSGSMLVSVHRPELYAAAVFRAELARAGVTVAGGTVALTTPATSRHRLARDTSMRLDDLLVPFLKLSNNMHAEALTKAMGAARSGTPGRWSSGLAATTAYLRSLGVPMGGVALSDGSGLTRRNTLTARALATTLQKVRGEPWFAAFDAALPVAGDPRRMTGGTLRHRMNGTSAARNAHAKTGSLTGVTSLSGYVRGADGRRYVFALISNYTDASPRPVEDRLVTTLAGWRR